ncbi:MAG: hypothetical protein WCO07_00800 [bacterium]
MKKLIIVIVILVFVYLAFCLVFDSFIVGYKNNHFIVYKYTCADVCPQQGYWYKRYYGNISYQQCISLGGEPALVGFLNKNNPIGGYDGCKVK